MNPIRIQVHGQTSVVIGSIVSGVILLFIAIFMLSTMEPIFEDRLTECSFTNTAVSAASQLNATTTSGFTSANITFASATNVVGSCYVTINVSNESATAGSSLLVRDALTLATISNITVPASWTNPGGTTAITHSTGNWLANVTAIGDDNLSVASAGTFFRCCSSLVSQAGPAGQHYNNVVAMIATIFAVIGLLLIVVGLSVAMASLKNMF